MDSKNFEGVMIKVLNLARCKRKIQLKLSICVLLCVFPFISEISVLFAVLSNICVAETPSKTILIFEVVHLITFCF